MVSNTNNPEPDPIARGCIDLGQVVDFDRIAYFLEAAGFDHTEPLLKYLVSQPIPTEVLLDRVIKALAADVVAGVNGYESELFKVQLETKMGDLVLFSMLPRIHQDGDFYVPETANFLAVADAAPEADSYQGVLFDIAANDASATTFWAAQLLIASSLLEHSVQQSHRYDCAGDLQIVLGDKIRFADDKLKSYLSKTAEIEQFYLTIKNSNLYSDSSEVQEILIELLSSLHTDRDFSWDVDFLPDDRPTTYYLPTFELVSEGLTSDALVDGVSDTWYDLKKTHELRVVLDPIDNQEALDIWRNPAETILSVRGERADVPMLLSAYELYWSRPSSPNELVSVESLKTLENPLQRSNGSQFLQTVLAALPDNGIKRILIPDDWLLTPFSEEQKHIAKLLEHSSVQITIEEHRIEVNRFLDRAADFLERGTQQHFLAYLSSGGITIPEAIPRGVAHVFEFVDLLRSMDVAVEFYKHRAYKSVIDSNTLFISKRQVTENIIDRIHPDKGLAPLIIDHALVSESDTPHTFKKETVSRDALRAKISAVHHSLAEIHGHDSTASVASLVMPGDDFSQFFADLPQSPSSGVRVRSADLYVTTVKGDYEGEITADEPTVSDLVDSPV